MIAPVLALVLAAAPVLASIPPVPPEVKQAQGVLAQHMKGGAPETRVGSWVLYQFSGGNDRVHFMRLAVTGEETDKKGRPAWWMELEMGTHAKMVAPVAQMRMLVAKDAGISKDGVSRMIVSWGTVKPQELDDAAIELMFRELPRDPTDTPASRADPARAQITSRTGKPTRLVTLGGTVDAVPVEIRLRDTMIKRIWLSRQVPLLQLARLELPAIEHTMELRDYGADAKPRIVMPAPGSPLVGVTRLEDESQLDELHPAGGVDSPPGGKP